MDVERTMEFILEQQARNAVEREKFERGLKSLRTLVQVGLKMMVKLQEGQKQELRDGVREMHEERVAAAGRESSRSGLLGHNPQSLHLSIEVAALQAQRFGGAGDVAAGLFEFLEDVLAFLG